jgi:hypothetical protein
MSRFGNISSLIGKVSRSIANTGAYCNFFEISRKPSGVLTMDLRGIVVFDGDAFRKIEGMVL